MRTITRKITPIGITLLFIALAIFVVVWYRNRPDASVPLVFSDKSMMESLWDKYKLSTLEPGTNRTLNKQQGNITTSEGESYTMFRAVMMDDQGTFDASYKWTNDILKHQNDHLFSWLFGERPDGTYGVLTAQGGGNSASDADSDIALSLVFAYDRWHQDSYKDDALAIINDIWSKEVVTIKGVPYLTANNVEKITSQKVIVDPSYFSPYAYRIFSKIDPAHPWMDLVDSSYDVLNATTISRLDKSSSADLPPDWIVIDKTTGVISAPTTENLTTNFGFDALRVPWRIALDYEWNKEPRAKAYLDQLSFLGKEWRKNKKIDTSYSHDGTVLDGMEAPAMYGGIIGYFMVSDPKDAADVYATKLKALFNPDTNDWKKPLGYYDDNWAWLGIGLYNNLIQPL